MKTVKTENFMKPFHNTLHIVRKNEMLMMSNVEWENPETKIKYFP